MKKTLLASILLSTLTLPSLASANQAGDFLTRGGLTNVSPDSGKSGVYVEALGGDTPLSISVGDDTQLGLNFVYFFNTNWAIEVLAATPFTHDVTIHDSQGVSEGIFDVDVNGIALGEVTQLPPTVSALYYFDTSSDFKPYVAAGINYTIFFDEEFEAAPKSLGFKNLELDASLGLSFQVGADYHINDNWYVNASARYIDIDTRVTFDIGDTIKGSSEVDVDPMVYSLVLGYIF